VPLPTYPFQRRRYWLESGSGPGDLSAAGLAAADHPLLGAVMESPEDEGLSLSGSISLATHPWLADHVVAGQVLFPGTAFLELALAAADRCGAGGVGELTLEAPLVLAAGGSVALRVSVGAPDPEGTCAIAIHSRPTGGEEEWVRHAAGSLAEVEAPAAPDLTQWPPEGAEPLDLADLYPRLAEIGLEYGPAFQGLTRAWRGAEGEVLAEVELAPEQAEEAGSFLLHPALSDAALHAAALAGEDEDEPLRLPFAWNGVSVATMGAATARVVLRPGEGEGTLALSLADAEGRPLASVASLATRPLPAAGTLSGGGDDLFTVGWRELESAEGAAEEPVGELLEPLADLGEGPHPPLTTTGAALEAILPHLEAEGAAPAALITRGAVAATDGESPDPAAAAVWGLVRSTQAEHPGRLLLVDLDDSDSSAEALPGALGRAIAAGETQLALREGRVLVPRLQEGLGGTLLPPPGPWRLEAIERGTLESLAPVPDPGAAEPLSPTEVRIAMRAAGLNFRDVLIALGLYPGQEPIGGEGAGVVVEVGSEVEDLAPGDRVVGIVPEAFATLARGDRATLARVPSGWSFEQAAAIPVVFLTAAHGLYDLADLQAGERVLIHAGAGGVGMAAIGLARLRGAEVYSGSARGSSRRPGARASTSS